MLRDRPAPTQQGWNEGQLMQPAALGCLGLTAAIGRTAPCSQLQGLQASFNPFKWFGEAEKNLEVRCVSVALSKRLLKDPTRGFVWASQNKTVSMDVVLT